jgi:predicted metal-dependent peptidase
MRWEGGRMKDEAKQAMERAIYQLLTRVGPFYACTITAMQAKYSTDVDTLGVRFTKEEKVLELIVNPEFFLGLTEPERVGVLLHEALHVINLHLLQRVSDFPDHRNGNIAQDIAINQPIAAQNASICALPKGGLMPKEFGFAANKSADHYYGELTKEQEQPQQQEGGDGQGNDQQQDQQQQDGGQQQQKQKKGNNKAQQAASKVNSDGTSLDSHDWDCDGKPTQEKVEALKNTLERAKERAEKCGVAGKLPAELQEALDTLERMKVRQWHKELQRFVAKNTDGCDRVRTWSRRNKRYGLMEAGSKSGENRKLIIGVDTSGSMSQADLEQALAECKSMLRSSVEAEVWFFDTQVNKKYKLKKGGSYDVGGRGGTDFNDFLKQAQRKQPDGLIIFTDGEDGHTVQEPTKVPLLMVLTAGDRETYDWCRKVVLDK